MVFLQKPETQEMLAGGAFTTAFLAGAYYVLTSNDKVRKSPLKISYLGQ